VLFILSIAASQSPLMGGAAQPDRTRNGSR
jgi:hypothetical protein